MVDRRLAGAAASEPAPSSWVESFVRRHGLAADFIVTAERWWTPLALDVMLLRERIERPLLVGISGSQGSGKSTLATFIEEFVFASGKWRVASLSLDDLYLSHDARLALGREMHPLLATRGVPGTHDVRLGIKTLRALMRSGFGGGHPIPRFDKVEDDPVPRARWPRVQTPVDIILLEGWCVSARPQAEGELREPVNALERSADSDSRWRRYVNARLAGDYQALFSNIDRLVFLKAPGFDVVRGWRGRQEAMLMDDGSARQNRAKAMNPAELDRFVALYERLTRHMMATTPAYADVTYHLDERQRVISSLGDLLAKAGDRPSVADQDKS